MMLGSDVSVYVCGGEKRRRTLMMMVRRQGCVQLSVIATNLGLRESGCHQRSNHSLGGGGSLNTMTGIPAGAASGNENDNMRISRCEIEYSCRQLIRNHIVVAYRQINLHESGRG